MKHLFKPGQSGHPVFVLLHGTGGDETNMLPVADYLDPQASVLSVRGQVNENGAWRFFARLAEGHYDEEDLYRRGRDLATFIQESADTYDFDLADIVLVGFSNGANIAINLLLADDSPFTKSILLSPMYPVDTSHLTQKKDQTQVFISYGKEDPICPLAASQEVFQLFEDRGAQVETYQVQTHEIRPDALDAAKVWLGS